MAEPQMSYWFRVRDADNRALRDCFRESRKEERALVNLRARLERGRSLPRDLPDEIDEDAREET